jgi:hypothetical protein
MRIVLILLLLKNGFANCQSFVFSKFTFQLNASNIQLPGNYYSFLPIKQFGININYFVSDKYFWGVHYNIWNSDEYTGVAASIGDGIIRYKWLRCGANSDYLKCKNVIASKYKFSFVDIDFGVNNNFRNHISKTTFSPSVAFGTIEKIDSVVKKNMPFIYEVDIYNSTKKELLFGIALKQSFLHEIKNTNFMYGFHIGVRDYFKYYTDVQIELGLNFGYRKLY